MHLACGDVYLKGWVNVDLHSSKADVKADAKALPFESNSFDYIETNHLIEHLEAFDAVPALSEWLRVLRPGGHVFISCPDIIACMSALRDSRGTPDLWSGFLRAVYGESRPGYFHRYGYSTESLGAAMTEAGFVDVEVKTAIGYRPTPSLIGIGKKKEDTRKELENV
jgi:SAM-dependent methyltransferase